MPRKPFLPLRALAANAFSRPLARLRAMFARDAYRPEAHYMRGPGPKSRARTHAGPPTEAS